MTMAAPRSEPEHHGAAAPARREVDFAGARGRFERFLRWTRVEEAPACAAFLPESERAAFAAHGHDLPSPGDTARIDAYLRREWRGATGWAARWIAERVWAEASRGMTPRVLDAGSGFGTHAMLFAAMGAEVFGLDLKPERKSAADRRARHYAASTGRPLECRFECADLTREWERGYDVVWVHDAWAEFAPLDGFLGEARRKLRPGGVLIVADRNGAHPAHRSTGAGAGAAPVAETLVPAALRERILRDGFGITHHELFWGNSASGPDFLHAMVRSPLQRRWRWGEGFARRQLFVAGTR